MLGVRVGSPFTPSRASPYPLGRPGGFRLSVVGCVDAVRSKMFLQPIQKYWRSTKPLLGGEFSQSRNFIDPHVATSGMSVSFFLSPDTYWYVVRVQYFLHAIGTLWNVRVQWWGSDKCTTVWTHSQLVRMHMSCKTAGKLSKARSRLCRSKHASKQVRSVLLREESQILQVNTRWN